MPGKTAGRFARRGTRGAIVVPVLAAMALVLAACAPAVPTHHTAAPHHTASGGTPGSSATPAVAPPKVRIPLACNQLEPASSLNSILGTTMTLTDEFPDPDLTKYVAIQDGALNCYWTGPTVGGSQSASWTVLAMPDATATWNTYLGDQQAPFPAGYLGAGVYGYCNAQASDPHAESCGIDMMVGSVWLEIVGTTSAIAATPSPDQVQAAFKPLFTSAIAAIKGVTVSEPAWSDPDATAVHLPTPADQGAVDQDAFAAAIGVRYAIEVSQPQFDLAGGQIAEMLPVDYRQDGGGGTGAGDTVTPATDYGMTVEILPSGSWAFAQMRSAAAGKPGFAMVGGLGTRAMIYTGPGNADAADDTIVVGTVGEHLYSIEVQDPGTAGTPDTVTLAKAAAKYVIGELSN